MAIKLIFLCLLSHCLSVLNGFGATIAVLFKLSYYQMSNNYFISFFHSPHCFLKGIAHSIGIAYNLINLAKATPSVLEDAHCNNSNKILCHSGALSLVATGVSPRVAAYFFNGKCFCTILFCFAVILGY